MGWQREGIGANMFRSLLFAIGIFLLIFGAQTLFVDKWIMSYEIPAGQPVAANNQYYNSPYRTAGFSQNRNSQFARGTQRYGNASPASYGQQAVNTIKPVYQTLDWMPWSLLAGGTMIVLYTYSTGQRVQD